MIEPRPETTRTPALDTITVGTPLPEIVDVITYKRVIMNPAATWDYFPGHHDPEYARSIGFRTIFVNTMHLAGFVDRVATQWAGPRSLVKRRRLTLHVPVFSGDTITGRGRVAALPIDSPDEADRCLVALELTVTKTGDVLCATAAITVEFPSG